MEDNYEINLNDIFLSVLLEEFNKIFKNKKSFYLSLKRNLIVNFLVFNILTNSMSYSSRALYLLDLNNYNLLLNNLKIEEDTQINFKELLEAIKVNFNQVVQQQRMSISKMENILDSNENIYEEMRTFVKHNENLTDTQLNNLLNYMCDANSISSSYFENEEEVLKYLFTNPDRKYEEKMIIIMIRENLTFKELDTICASVVAESGSVNNYEETYHVASVLNNRIHSKTFVAEFGPSLYDQLIAEGQFSVVAYDSYQAFLDKMYLEGYRGAIDMFYTGIPSNNYLFFLSKNSTKEDAVQLTENGNKYYSELEDEDRIEDIIQIDYTEKYKEYEKKLGL